MRGSVAKKIRGRKRGRVITDKTPDVYGFDKSKRPHPVVQKGRMELATGWIIPVWFKGLLYPVINPSRNYYRNLKREYTRGQR